MKINLKTAFTIFSAVGLSYACLFVFGNLGGILAYKDLGVLPELKLNLLKIIFFTALTLSIFYLVQKLVSHDKYSLKALFFIGVIDLVIVRHLTSIGTYISIGDLLRDTHGINWYAMDYAGWAITMSLFLISIVGAVLFFVTGRVFNRRLRK